MFDGCKNPDPQLYQKHFLEKMGRDSRILHLNLDFTEIANKKCRLEYSSGCVVFRVEKLVILQLQFIGLVKKIMVADSAPVSLPFTRNIMTQPIPENS